MAEGIEAAKAGAIGSSRFCHIFCLLTENFQILFI
jgi:hypothetical protein